MRSVANYKYVLLALGVVGVLVLAGWVSSVLEGWGNPTWGGVSLGLFLLYIIIGRAWSGMVGPWGKGQAPRWLNLIFSSATAIGIVWVAVGYFGRLTTISFVPGMNEPTAQLRLSEGDRVLAVVADWPKQTSTSFRGLYNQLDLKVEMLGPGGWVERPSSFDSNGPTLKLYDYR